MKLTNIELMREIERTQHLLRDLEVERDRRRRDTGGEKNPAAFKVWEARRIAVQELLRREEADGYPADPQALRAAQLAEKEAGWELLL